MAVCAICFRNWGHELWCERRELITNVVAEWQGDPNDWRLVRSEGHVNSIFKATKSLELSYFSCPLITQVGDTNLWQGGCVQDVEIGDFFDTVVSLYPWERYTIQENVDRFEFVMHDDAHGVLFEDLYEASSIALEALENDNRVLVHCQAGLNRSGLVSAFTLMRQGMSAQDAIDLLRRERSGLVLCNKTFVKQLHDLENRRDEWM